MCEYSFYAISIPRKKKDRTSVSYIYIHYNVKSNPFGIDLFPSGVVSRHLSYQTRMNLSQEISPYFPHRLSTFHARTV